MDAMVTDVSERPIETSDKGERYVVVSFQEAEGKVIGTPEGVEVWEAMSPAEMQIADLRDKAVELAERASKAEFAVDYDRAAAGLKFIELRAMVQATEQGWEEWFAKHVHRVSLRTAQRYMALAVAPEKPLRTPREAAAGAVEAKADGTDDSVSPDATRTEPLKESPRRRLATLVSKLSETEAEQVLAMVMKWRAKR
jgi:hypothetical protein